MKEGEKERGKKVRIGIENGKKEGLKLIEGVRRHSETIEILMQGRE